VRLWIDAVGIPLVLALLGLWQFWLKEVKWPAQAPVNLTAELSIKDVGSGATPGEAPNSEDGLQAVELEVTARNASTRSIYLLNNLWVAYGVKIDSGKPDWREAMESHLNGDHRIVGGEHYATTPPIPVAVGNAFSDTGLQPNEKIVRSYVFYVPRGRYDYVEVNVALPTTAIEMPGGGGPIAEVKYALRPDRSSYLPVVYRVTSGGGLVEAGKEDDAALKLQWALSTRMLSLWDGAHPEVVVDKR
jgi:hypothetical protein